MQTKAIDFQPGMLNLPHADQWFGVWAIEQSAGDGLLQLAQGIDLATHLITFAQAQQAINAASGSSGSKAYRYREDADGVAVIKLTGTLQKQVASLSGGTSTVIARRELRDAVADDSIGAILLSIESPGGTVAGTEELALEVASAASKKYVHAHITDLGASAAYWIASQASRVTANRAGLVGSIGTYTVVIDASGMAAKEGVKVHVVRAGAYKGMGTMGTEITPDQLAEIQRLVDSRNEMFLGGVSTGRKMAIEQVRQLADGRVHASSDAIGLGLIDSVNSFESAMAVASESAQRHLSKFRSKRKMSESAVATVAQIKAACPGATSDFIVECQEQSRTIEQSANVWMASLTKQNAELREQLAKANIELADANKAREAAEAKANATTTTANTTKTGVEPLTSGKGSESESVSASDYWSAVSELVAAGKNNAEAMMQINRTRPELRKAMVAAANRR